MPNVFFKFYQFAEDLGKAKHNFTSEGTGAVTIALTSSGAAPTSTASVLADLVEVAYTNLSTRAVSGITWEQTTGTAHMTATDHTLTATGDVATFRYVVIYNDTPAGDPLIGWYDYGSDVTMHNGETFKVDFATDILTLA